MSRCKSTVVERNDRSKKYRCELPEGHENHKNGVMSWKTFDKTRPDNAVSRNRPATPVRSNAATNANGTRWRGEQDNRATFAPRTTQ